MNSQRSNRETCFHICFFTEVREKETVELISSFFPWLSLSLSQMLQQPLCADSPWTDSISLQGDCGGGRNNNTQQQQHTRLRSPYAGDLCKYVPSCQALYEPTVLPKHLSHRVIKVRGESCAEVIIQAWMGFLICYLLINLSIYYQDTFHDITALLWSIYLSEEDVYTSVQYYCDPMSTQLDSSLLHCLNLSTYNY